MIYVTLGTQNNDFSRCLKAVEELMEVMNIEEDVIAQTGYTSYRPKKIKCVDFISEKQYQEYISEARVVISHAGSGALFSSIAHGKKIIAMARLAKYGEMLNDHQLELVKKLTSDGYILDGTEDLIGAWKKIDDFVPRKNDFYCEIGVAIQQCLEEWGIRNKKN